MSLFSRLFGVEKPVDSVDKYGRLKELDEYCKKYGCLKCPIFRRHEWSCEKQDILESLNKGDIFKVIEDGKKV